MEQFHNATWVRMRISRPEWANSSNSWILHIPCSSPMFKYSTHSSSLGKNDQRPYYTSLNARLPSSDPHLRLMRMTQRIPTHIISHPDFKQRHSSVFTYNEYIVFSCWSWGLGNWMIHWDKMVIHQTKNLNKAISTPYRLRVTSKFTMPMARTYSWPNLGIC